MVDSKTTQLDARAMAPRERDTAILAAFDRLAVNETLEVVCEQETRTVYDTLRTTMGGDYAWITLDSRPQQWRGALTRLSARQPASRPGGAPAGETASESGCCGACGGVAHVELPRRSR